MKNNKLFDIQALDLRDSSNIINSSATCCCLSQFTPHLRPILREIEQKYYILLQVQVFSSVILPVARELQKIPIQIF
jgi:hypothetical protein